MFKFKCKYRFSGDAILVLYEPDRTLMNSENSSESTESSSESDKKKTKNGYNDELAMINATYRAVSEGLKALNDEYIVTPEELGTFSDDPDDPVNTEGIKLALHVAICAGGIRGGLIERLLVFIFIYMHIYLSIKYIYMLKCTCI